MTYAWHSGNVLRGSAQLLSNREILVGACAVLSCNNSISTLESPYTLLTPLPQLTRHQGKALPGFCPLLSGLSTVVSHCVTLSGSMLAPRLDHKVVLELLSKPDAVHQEPGP